MVSGLRIAAGRHGNNISSIGVDTWGVDFALLASDDSLLANPVSYRDSRTHGTLCAVEKIVSRKDIFNFTGVQFMEINTLYQLFAMQQKRSSVLQSADRLLLIPDLMHWLLTGRRSNERTNASTTQCLDPLTTRPPDAPRSTASATCRAIVVKPFAMKKNELFRHRLKSGTFCRFFSVEPKPTLSLSTVLANGEDLVDFF